MYKVLYMKEEDLYAELSSIKSLMERSTKFISLSGLSGVLAGIYALVGAALAYKIVYHPAPGIYRNYDQWLTAQLFVIALSILFLSIGTGIWLSIRKAKRRNESIWSPSSKALLIEGALPLLTGGCFILILLWQRHYGIIAPGCLIFYGLAIIAASKHTYGDVKWLGLCEIALGLIATLLPGYGLLFWAIGFGVLHVIYGTVMYFKYDRESSVN